MSDPGLPNLRQDWKTGDTIDASDINDQNRRINAVEDRDADDDAAIAANAAAAAAAGTAAAAAGTAAANAAAAAASAQAAVDALQTIVTALSADVADDVEPADLAAAVATLSAAIAGRESAITAGNAGQFWRGDKTWQALNKAAVGLGNVDNIADAAKAVLSATKLATARLINGVAFDGTADITVRDHITPEMFGAGGLGATDDLAALTACFAAAAGRKIRFAKNGIYKHSGILAIDQDFTQIEGNGATLLATVDAASEVLITGKYCRVEGLTLGITSAPVRLNDYEAQKLRVVGDYCTLQNVTIDGSAAAGVFTMAGYFTYINVVAKNTKADGFFTSEGAHDGTIFACTAKDVGDDGFSVVSYAGQPCHHITNIGSRVINGGARGFSVVGGQHVELIGPRVEGCAAAGLYIGAEGDGFEHITNVTVSGGILLNANQATGTDHGAILVVAWDSRSIRYVDILGLAVRDCRTTASANVRVIRYDPSTIQDVAISGVSVAGGPATLIALFGVDRATDRVYLNGVSRNGVSSDRAFCRQNATYTLASTTAAQKLFNASANGAVSLPAGVYRFVCQYSLSAMSSTSGNSAFSLVAGSAAIGSVLMSAVGIDGATATAATLTGSTSVTGAFPASQHTAGAGTTQQTLIEGTFKVTTEGTIIPSIALATAAAAVVAAGSFFECWRIMDNPAGTVAGEWS